MPNNSKRRGVQRLGKVGKGSGWRSRMGSMRSSGVSQYRKPSGGRKLR